MCDAPILAEKVSKFSLNILVPHTNIPLHSTPPTHHSATAPNTDNFFLYHFKASLIKNKIFYIIAF